jgi:hypothetical protein
MMSGPLNSYTLPPGPPEALSLPTGHSGAFQAENIVPERAWFAHIGTVAYLREKYGNEPLSFFDPSGIDTGTIPVGGFPLSNLHDVPQHQQWGVTGTVGYLWDSSAIEITGFSMFSSNISKQYVTRGNIDSFFFNPPLGFEGDNGLWLQADSQTLQQRTQLWSSEVNYRYTDLAVNDFELIIGVRYMNLKDTMGIFTDDDGIVFPQTNGHADPTRQATYQITSTNQLIGPQIGFEWDALLYKCVSWGVRGKAAYAVNFINTEHQLVRGDNFVGFDTSGKTTNGLAGIFEVGAFVEFHILEKCRLRGGYNVIWLTGVNMAQDQLDFNLANPPGNSDNHGSVYFHGPTIELQMLF